MRPSVTINERNLNLYNSIESTKSFVDKNENLHFTRKLNRLINLYTIRSSIKKAYYKNNSFAQWPKKKKHVFVKRKAERPKAHRRYDDQSVQAIGKDRVLKKAENNTKP